MGYFFRAFFVLFALFVLLACSGCPGTASQEDAAFLRAMNLGQAYLENKESAQAIEAFQAAVDRQERSAAALRNLARAHLLARESAVALEVLAKARALESESTATSYLTGLALARESLFEEALPHLEEAVRLDPETAALRFQLARAYQATQHSSEAVEQMKATVLLDPTHTTAHYRLARFALKAGNKEDYEKHDREVARLRELYGDAGRSDDLLEACVYTRAEPAIEAVDRPSAGPQVEVRFVDDSTITGLEGALTAAVLDVEDAGDYTLLVTHAEGSPHLLNLGGGSSSRAAALNPSTPLVPDATAPLVGNFYDRVSAGTTYDPAKHALNDVLLLGPEGTHLLERTGPESFDDITTAAGLADLVGHRAHWVDYDHDGDLDLLVAAPTLSLWQNNGDATFVDVTAEVGIDAGISAVDVVAVDLDDDVAVDLVVARGAEPTVVYHNQRTGSFAPMAEPPGPWPAAQQVLANDLDGDGEVDVVLVGEAEVVIIPGGPGSRRRLDLEGLDVTSALLVDYDNDGRLDLLLAGTSGEAAGGGVLRLWHNDGAAGWNSRETATGLDALTVAAVREAAAADLDADGDTDLLLTTNAGLRVLRNEGGHLNRQVKIRLLGSKTNASGLGTRVEVREGSFLAARAVHTLPLEIGVGPRQQLDAVQTVWTNGVVDNQVEVAVTAQTLEVAEKSVAAGSCPFLYAWDGEGFRFVTDLLGNSPLGLSLKRGVPLAADPDEFVWVGNEDNLVPRDGAYVLQVTEEMREVLYLDDAQLLAVDHPSGVEIHPTDKLMAPPFPPSELWALGSLTPPRQAQGDDGVERTAELSSLDGEFAPAGVPLPPPLRGMTAPLALRLDFGPLDAWRRPVLALTGWLQYGDASTNIALSQNREVTVVPPMLEAEGSDGRWQKLDIPVGMPAGKTKTILVDLAGKLPRGVRSLRLTTTFEIRWDRIALGERLDDAVTTVQDLPLVQAELGWHGFSEIRARAPRHPTTPEWSLAAEHPPWRTGLRGWVTRYGDVRELVNERDERLALLHAGDALELHFAADGLPPVLPEKVRTFFFYSVGWDKDGDHNVIDGETVEPLPVVSADDAWRWQYNTRWISGR